MRWALITLKVGVEDILTAEAVNSTVEGFPTPSLPNHSGKPYCTVIKDTHQLLTANAASIKCVLGGGQSSYL